MARRKRQAVLRSGLEDKVKEELDTCKIKYEYETLQIPYTIPASDRNYNPDFILPNGVIIEVKGKLDVDTRRKMLLVKKQNPDDDIRFIFDLNNLLVRRGKVRYADWAKRWGFPCCFIRPGKNHDQPKSWQEILVEWANEPVPTKD